MSNRPHDSMEPFALHGMRRVVPPQEIVQEISGMDDHVLPALQVSDKAEELLMEKFMLMDWQDSAQAVHSTRIISIRKIADYRSDWRAKMVLRRNSL